ncbi:MAG: DASS family sodium-coupled anion symporter [Cellulosilyticum sp.]|nr:DASS family sodium-coupled anion symporter [Cellulosilyticum sp.]
MEISSKSVKKKLSFEQWMKIAGIAVSLLVFAGIFTMPTPVQMTVQAKSSLAVFGMVFVLWVTQAVPTYASALVAIVMLVFTGGWTQKEALAVLGQDVIWLMLAAFIITSGMEKSGFAKRMALFIVAKFGTTARRALIALGVVNLLLAFVVPSTTARAAMLLPICLMILQVYQAEPGKSNFGKQLMIQEIHFNNISTSGILTATAGQIMAVSYILDMAEVDVTWGQWFMASMPIAVLTLIASFIIGELLFKSEVKLPPVTEGKSASESLKAQLKELGPITSTEIKALCIFAVTVFLWATDGYHLDLFGFQISLVMVAIFASALFFLPYIGVLNWKETKIPWDLMVFSAGAYAVGLSLDASGAASFLLNTVFDKFNLEALSPFALFMIVMFVASFSHLVFTSKTVRVVILLPAIILIANKLGVNPVLLALPASFTICDSITLPPHCKPNLIFYSTGYFSVKDQFIYGMLVLAAKWLIFGLAYFTWFRVIGLV